ncbi:8191_t:CDS:2, partial [Acaulospora morrowiae]
AIGLEYSYLLSTQLSSQRTYYEEKLESVTLQLSNLTNQLQKLSNEKTVEKKVEKFVEKSERLERELNEEKELTKSLLSKQEYLQTQLEDRDSKIKDLEEQVRDLMFFFSAQDKMAENPELAGGNVVIPENNGGNTRKKKCKK